MQNFLWNATLGCFSGGLITESGPKREMHETTFPTDFESPGEDLSKKIRMLLGGLWQQMRYNRKGTMEIQLIVFRCSADGVAYIQSPYKLGYMDEGNYSDGNLTI
ncbi:hypothetical protein HNY73_015632 [Argiope bruennichi]|uniref:Uncharacterized protein n=1 Tax=Argiope bruennichi TaxID=94029 RepID=A0A8T0EU60_ARGBR|nr:hypothetical protein HNY73_015632 [Argiope bruennichi]